MHNVINFNILDKNILSLLRESESNQHKQLLS